MNHFLAQNNIKREKYFKVSLFLKFFDTLCNEPSRWRQKFAVRVTKLMPPDEIRRFDGISEKISCFHWPYPTNQKRYPASSDPIQPIRRDIMLPLTLSNQSEEISETLSNLSEDISYCDRPYPSCQKRYPAATELIQPTRRGPTVTDPIQPIRRGLRHWPYPNQ